ncbi:hypothetical protein SUDANB95_01885 [Actinosynnema sp. ALI-1.44]
MRRAVLSCLPLALLSGTVAGPAAADAEPERTQSPAPTTTVRGRVTLLSGDVVTVFEQNGRLSARPQPGPGRAGTAFRIEQTATSLSVVPQDAEADLGSGKLDPRLFDVRLLLDHAYDDEHRADLPLIVQGEGARALTPSGLSVRQAFDGVDAVAATQSKAEATASWNARAGWGKVWLDGKRTPVLDVSVPQIGAPAAWRAGHTGKGSTVAVIDTGIDTTHPDLAGKVVEQRDFTGGDDPDDLVGHGTHVASTIAGSGAKSGGKYKGVAPDATLLNAKVCATNSCSESAILAGMHWAAESGAHVVNISLGGPDTPGIDPLEEAVNALTERHNTLFVVAAGNAGAVEPEATVSSPASADAALAVGAVDKNDRLAPFSSRGPRVGDAALKPEITAPGVAVVAAKARHATFDGPGPEGYLELSGTSMATPHVAGAAAILAAQHPKRTAAEYKAMLTAAAAPTEGVGVYAQGAGRVDVGRATRQTTRTDPAVLSLGRAAWPHQDDEPITRKVTYHNDSDQPTTYRLSVTATGPDGKPAPEGMFRLDATELTVPPHGSTAVDFTADTRAGTVDGYHGGRIVATAGDTVVQTPFAVNREGEHRTLDLSAVDVDGGPTELSAVVMSKATGRVHHVYDPSGRASLRLPVGEYGVNSPSGTGQRVYHLVQPSLTLAKDEALVLDRRLAKPVAYTFPSGGVRAADLYTTTAHVADNRVMLVVDILMMGGLTPDVPGLRIFTANLGPQVPEDRFWASLNGAYEGGDNLYFTAAYSRGRMFDGYQRTLTTRDLAAVETRHHAPAPSRHEWTYAQAWPKWRYGSFPYAFASPFKLPAVKTRYFTTDDGLEWTTGSYVLRFDGDAGAGPAAQEGFAFTRFTRYEPGRRYHASFHAAVHGPVLPAFEPFPSGLTRTGNTINAWIALFSPADPDQVGNSFPDFGRTALFRDGTKIGETPAAGRADFTVPADAAGYRLEVEAKRSDSAFSTHVQLAQTFRSGHVGDETALPVTVLRYRPEVDLTNHARAGRLARLPIEVQRQRGATNTPRAVELSVSYDDGKSWQRVPVLRTGHDTYTALYRHPDRQTFVSLKAKATDNLGGITEQTVIRAYGVR